MVAYNHNLKTSHALFESSELAKLNLIWNMNQMISGVIQFYINLFSLMLMLDIIKNKTSKLIFFYLGILTVPPQIIETKYVWGNI